MRTLAEQIALATAVIQLRTSDADIDLLQQTVKAFQHFLNVVADQDKFGTIPPSDVISARHQLETAQSSLIALGVARAQDEHAIAVLVRQEPRRPGHPAQHRDAHVAGDSGWRSFDPAAAPA